MKKSLPRAVVFDWDNTLVDSWGTIGDAINVTRRHFGMSPWGLDEVKANCVRSARESFPEWFGDRWQEASDVFYARFSEVQMKNITPLEGSAELLAWLKTQGIPAFVVSNKNGVFLRRESEALGWDSYFVAVVGATDALRDKPAREHVDHALRQGGVETGADVWFIGDSEIDMTCARNAACTPVLIGSGETARKWGIETFAADCGELLNILSAQQNK